MFRRVVHLTVFVISIGVAIGASSADAAEDAKKPVMGVFTLGGGITEAPMGEEFPFSLPAESFRSLLDRLGKIEKDETAKGVVLQSRQPGPHDAPAIFSE